nr:L,D-transpeptidase family protein [uncultured Roseococcus sp.]
MIPPRRSFAASLLLGGLPLLLGRAASAQTRPTPVSARQPAPPLPRPPLTLADIRAQLEIARAALPPGHRNRVAVERTLGRLDEMGLDLASGRTILVNIAAAEVMAYEDGIEVLRSRAVVGAARTRTPQMTTFVTTARFNPPWYVPASLTAEIRAAGAVGYQQIGGRFIQPPGPNNALGPMRIGLENSDGIFLHGTNRPSLFNQGMRSLSHGCVRVERVRDFTAWLLDMPVATVDTMLASGRTQDVHPLREVQVALAYLTIWPDRTGQFVVHPDRYGMDAPGVRQVSFRRVLRPLPMTTEQMEAAARQPPPEDDPL